MVESVGDGAGGDCVSDECGVEAGPRGAHYCGDLVDAGRDGEDLRELLKLFRGDGEQVEVTLGVHLAAVLGVETAGNVADPRVLREVVCGHPGRNETGVVLGPVSYSHHRQRGGFPEVEDGAD